LRPAEGIENYPETLENATWGPESKKIYGSQHIQRDPLSAVDKRIQVFESLRCSVAIERSQFTNRYFEPGFAKQAYFPKHKRVRQRRKS